MGLADAKPEFFAANFTPALSLKRRGSNGKSLIELGFVPPLSEGEARWGMGFADGAKNFKS